MLHYDKYIVTFSGGKDSIACFLHLLEIGVPKDKIELWHHDIDGKEETFMDWECTPAYCKAFAEAFGVKIYFSWKEGGFEREMLRENCLTAPTSFENENGEVITVGGVGGKIQTRLRFPQVSADLSVRWCSSYLKIDVCCTAIVNQNRFNGIKTLVLSGERGEESPARAKYEIHEVDRADNRYNGFQYIYHKKTANKMLFIQGESNRHVDRWRPVRDWKEAEIWDIIKRHKVRVHPAYYLGWGRVSCKFCIFGNANQFASAYKISPKQGDRIANYEKRFGCTVKRKESIPELISKGKAYENTDNEELVKIATSYEYNLSVFIDDWQLPAGAFGESCGSI